MSKYNLERQEQIRVQILRIAKQLAAGEISVIAASRQLSHFRHDVELPLAHILLTFAAIDSETDALPVGDARREWSAEALERKDREITEAEDFYRNTAIDAANELVRLLETPS